MGFKPGQSGNPNGRPKKQRALTAILERAGSKTYSFNGKTVAAKRALASMLWQAAMTGTITLPPDENGKVRYKDLPPKEYIDLVKWLYNQIDGPPKSETDVNLSGVVGIRWDLETKSDSRS
jgi:hypothetical protein